MILLAATVITLHFTVPSTQGDSLRFCQPGVVPCNPDSVRLVGWGRVKGWPWWPVGWYVPAQKTLAQKPVAAWRRGSPDSLSFVLPSGPDSTVTVAQQTHSVAGWSCASNGQTFTVEVQP